MIGVISTSLFSARYASNEITANYLIQEAIDYVRNERDTMAIQRKNNDTWATFLDRYNIAGCFGANGCKVEPTASTISTCDITGGVICESLNYDASANSANKDFYTYTTPVGYVPTSFRRKIQMTTTPINASTNDQLNIIVTVEWKNGKLAKSRTYRTSLLNWSQ
jgi:hypothetical protein